MAVKSKPSLPTITADYLYQKYIVEGLTIEEIGKLFKRDSATIRYYFRKFKIPTRRRGPKDKHTKKSFSRNLIEKAYLLGIKCGDFHAYKEYNCIVVSITTTHPAMLELFHKIFDKYGKVKVRPLFCNSLGYEWNAYCRLDKSFNFLLWAKENGIPRWIKNNNKYFLSFFSGYFDAEGHISITKNKDGNKCRLRCQLNSKDYQILKDAQRKLALFSIFSRLRKGKYNMWRFDICRKKDVIKFLKLLKLRHREKIMKKKLAFEAYNKTWEEIHPLLQEFKSKLKREVKESILKAKKEWEKHGGRNL